MQPDWDGGYFMAVDVSIIIPIYNVEKYLNQCFDSILSQDGIEFEIIAIDDGSPDNCPLIIDDYAAKDQRIHVIHQKNSGVSVARNVGLNLARGKWCYFVDSDDWLEHRQFKKVINYAKETDADVVFLDFIEQYENGTYEQKHLFSHKFYTQDASIIADVQKSILCHKYSPFFSPGADSAYPAPWSKLIKTGLLKAHAIAFDPYVGGLYDDGLFTLEILDVAKSIAYIPIHLYNYRILTSSIVHSYRNGIIDKFEKNCERVSAFAERNHKDASFYNAEYCRRIAYLSSFLTAYYYSDSNPLSLKEKKTELLSTINRSPWKEAIELADNKYLETKHKCTHFCMKYHFILGLRLYSQLKKIKNKRAIQK